MTAGLGAFLDLAHRLQGLGAARRHIMAGLGEEVLELIAQGFADEQAPDGSPWAPKVFPDGRSILVGETASLRRGWHRTRLSDTEVTVAPSPFYAIVHQEGRTITPVRAKWLIYHAGGKTIRSKRSRIPARPMVPDGVLPGRWRDQLAEAADEMLTELLSPGGRRG